MPASSTAHKAPRPVGESYVPLALRPGWVLERFWGWSVLHEEPSIKLLERRTGPVVRYLLLAKEALPGSIDDVAARHHIFRPIAIVSLNDFSATGNEASRVVAGHKLERAAGPRWFGVGTFVLDLDEEEAALHRRIAGKEWSLLRRPQEAAFSCEVIERPAAEDLDEFRRLYEPLARERRLERFSASLLDRIAAAGCLMLARCRDGDGHTLVVNLIYRAHAQGYFFASARAAGTPAGASRLAHWEAARRLKRDGCRFYDLGLVRSIERDDGIHRFKRSLGGTFVTSGSEFGWVSRIIAWAYRGRVEWRRRRDPNG
jgi:GNAT acetyltransferase-like protein